MTEKLRSAWAERRAARLLRLSRWLQDVSRRAGALARAMDPEVAEKPIRWYDIPGITFFPSMALWLAGTAALAYLAWWAL